MEETVQIFGKCLLWRSVCIEGYETCSARRTGSLKYEQNSLSSEAVSVVTNLHYLLASSKHFRSHFEEHYWPESGRNRCINRLSPALDVRDFRD